MARKISKKTIILSLYSLFIINPKLVKADSIKYYISYQASEIPFINPNNLILIVTPCIFILLLLAIILFIKKRTKTLSSEFNKIIPNLDFEQLKTDIFNLYKNIEIADSKYKYDELKQYLTPKLYLQLEKQLQQRQKQQYKKVATNITYQSMQIISIQKESEFEIIKAILHVSQYDYLINKQKQLIRGTDEAKYQAEYKLTIEKQNDTYQLSEKQCIGKWISK